PCSPVYPRPNFGQIYLRSTCSRAAIAHAATRAPSARAGDRTMRRYLGVGVAWLFGVILTSPLFGQEVPNLPPPGPVEAPKHPAAGPAEGPTAGSESAPDKPQPPPGARHCVAHG